MADLGTPAPSSAPAAPASASPTPAPVAAPVAASAPAAPALAAAPDPATSTTPPGVLPSPSTPAAAPSTPAPAPVAAPAAPVAPKLGDSLLGSASGAEPAPAAADPTAPAPIAPAALPSYSDYKLPEGVQLEAEAIGSFNKLLGEFETGAKADHAAVEALGQKMVDFYIAEQDRAAKANVEAWTAMRDGWRDQFKADPEIGGARTESTLRAAGAVIERFGGTPEQQQELRAAFGMTGMGDHPAMIRFLAKIGSTLREGQPVAAPPTARPPVSRSTRRYSSTLSPNGAN